MSTLQEVPVELPYGCKIAKRIVNGERQAVVEPCSLTCEFYRYAIGETERQGKPVRMEAGGFGPDGRIRADGS